MQTSSPEVAVADAAIQRIAMEAIQLLAKIRLVRFQIADHPYDDRILGRHVEDPLVVFQPGAGFHFDGAYYAERRRDLAIAIRQSRLIKDGVLLGRPRYALRTPRIEQMDVRIDDGH